MGKRIKEVRVWGVELLAQRGAKNFLDGLRYTHVSSLLLPAASARSARCLDQTTWHQLPKDSVASREPQHFILFFIFFKLT